MNAIAQVTEEQVVSHSSALLQVIERAATNPAVDIDKMERLLDMQERIIARDAKAAYAAALAEMAPELPVIVERGGIKDRAGKVQSTYALWEDVNDAIKPVLAKHGFALSFRTGREEGQITVTGVLSHRHGHSEETTITLPHDSSGSKNAVQAVGSSTSYGKRYTAGLLLNLTSRGEDDDGAAGGSAEVAPATQAALDQIDALSSLEDCTAWHGKHAAGLKSMLSPRDLSRVEAAFSAKRRELRVVAQ